MVNTTFKSISRAEYEEIKVEILKKFGFVKVKRHPQAYAFGGFSITPKDYENGFNKEQIDSICEYLISIKVDDSYLDVSKGEVYPEGQGEFTGTPKAHLIFKDGFNFLMRRLDDD